MAFESITDEKIQELISLPKRVTNPNTRESKKAGHAQFNYKVITNDSSGVSFSIYTRQNLHSGMEDDFSCGIAWIAPNGEKLTLKRYNGPNHTHMNHLEKERLDYTFHIHTATRRYLEKRNKAEGFAESTDRFKTLQGALHCLVTDCNVSGIDTTPDQTDQLGLFDE